jgi:hypothetical protein
MTEQDYVELDDYAHFKDDPAVIERLFFEENETMRGLLKKIPDEEERAKAKQEIIAAIQSFLARLQKEDINQPEGGLKVIVKGHHIQLRKALLKIARAAIPVAAVAILGGDPSFEVVGAVAEGTTSTFELIQKLNDSELATCEAVLRVINRKKPLTLTVHKANLEEVEDIFDHDPELLRPGSVENTLKDLAGRGVLQKEEASGTTYYKVTF